MDLKMDTLFTEWMARENHMGTVFNRDGIVNLEEWKKQSTRILFLLKEAHHTKDCMQSSYDLAEDLRQNAPWNAMWSRVAEWTYGLLNTKLDHFPSYRRLNRPEANALIQKIAVINIKKSHGTSRSDDDDLMRYARDDAELLYRQIELINPTVIVCGYTMNYLNEILSRYDTPIDKKDHHCENWHYMWKEHMVLDYFHPANQYPALLSYYGLVGCYQDALQAQNNH